MVNYQIVKSSYETVENLQTVITVVPTQVDDGAA